MDWSEIRKIYKSYLTSGAMPSRHSSSQESLHALIILFIECGGNNEEVERMLDLIEKYSTNQSINNWIKNKTD